MRRLAALSAILFAVALAQVSAAPVTVRYVANAGFLIETDSVKLLIDAPFDDPTIDYCHVPDQETLDRMGNGEAPFDDLDLILITHGHRDHFAPGQVARHLASDPGCVVAGPPQAIDRLKAELPEESGLDGRIKRIDLELFESAELTLDGIRVQAHRVHHSEYMVTDPKSGEKYNRHQDVENLAYRIEIGEVSLLHVGDAVLPLNRDYFESDAFPRQKLHIVFLEFFDGSDETKQILRNWTPDQIVFMHLPAQPEQVERLDRQLSERFPEAVIFREPLEARSFGGP